jgi:integrase
MKFGDFFEKYFHEVKETIAENTYRRYCRSLHDFMSFIGAEVELNTITSKVIRSFAKKRLEMGYRPHSVNIDLRHIKASLGLACQWKLINIRPNIEMENVNDANPKYLSLDEFSKLLNFEKKEQYRRLWSFFAWTGLRRKEVFSLNWNHIKLGTPPYLLISSKGKFIRKVPLLPPALHTLGEPQKKGQVFPFKNIDSVTKHFTKTAKKAGLEKYQMRDLRITALSFIVSSGLSTDLILNYSRRLARKGTVMTFENRALTLIKFIMNNFDFTPHEVITAFKNNAEMVEFQKISEKLTNIDLQSEIYKMLLPFLKRKPTKDPVLGEKKGQFVSSEERNQQRPELDSENLDTSENLEAGRTIWKNKKRV